MPLIIIAGVAGIAFVAGFVVRGVRKRSPLEEYERRQRDEELAVRAGTMDEVAELVRQGNKLAAIKAYRSQTGSGLREAKDAVEALQHQAKLGFPTPANEH